MIKFIQQKDYQITNWSGGTTTELFIYPNDSKFQNMNFDIRISIATVEVKESVFTKLEGAKRILTVLKGEHSLSINRAPFQLIQPLNPIHFTGDDDVISKGLSHNFNVMTLGDYECEVSIIKGELDKKMSLLPSNMNSVFYYLQEGSIMMGNKILTTKDSFWIDHSVDVIGLTEFTLIQVEV